MKDKKKVISFPHMGNYYVPVKYLLSHVFHCKILVAPKITSRTIELGTKYSPDFVCTPFKYTLGTLIESLENGANILLQAGGGCKYGYYSELQIEILKSLGYQFEYVNLVSKGKMNIRRMYRMVKEIDPKFQIRKFLKYARITKRMVAYMDHFEDEVRKRIGFEKEEGSFENLEREMLHKFMKVKNMAQLKQRYKEYMKKMYALPLKEEQHPIRIGVIGELYTLMEPFSNYYLEKALAKYHISIKRFTNVNYLLFQKKHHIKYLLRFASRYIKYKMGADAADNIAWAKYLCEEGYDGIIHIKSSFCTPEIGAMPIIQKICHDYDVPVIFFTFDAGTTEVGIETRLEAFYDMLKEKRKEK